MERYASLTREQIATTLERKMSPLYHHGRSWLVSRNPLAFVSSWNKYQDKRPGTTLSDYLVLQLRGNIGTDWAPFYKLVKQVQLDFDDWRQRHPQGRMVKAQMKFLNQHILKVFGTVAGKIKGKQSKRGRIRERYDGGYLSGS